MFLIYIDESGNHTFKDPENFVYAALCIHENQWQIVDNKVQSIKLKHFPDIDPDNIELHAKDIVSGNKHYKGNLLYRMEILSDVYNLISEIDCCLFASIIDKRKINGNNFDVNHWSMKLLFERLCKYLDKTNRMHIENGEPTECALLLVESVNNKFDQKVRKRLLPWIRNGTEFRRNNHIIEDPLFVTSSYRSLSQLVDCVAYCVRRYYRGSDVSIDEYNRQFFALIHNKFDKDIFGKINNAGIKIFPA